MAVAREKGLGLLQWIDPSGRFTPNSGFVAGKFCKDADADIIRDLKDRGLLFKRET
jgi:isoleucyl-tRNA synthetase